jgi:hypothetical protein
MVGNAAEWVERRVYDPQQEALVQPFRGGSFLDHCIQALTFMDSRQAGVMFGAGEDDQVVGQTAYGWLGFRDVIDLQPEPRQPQGLVDIPPCEMEYRGREVEVPCFRMSRYAVSNLEYLEFVRATAHRMPQHWQRGQGLPFEGADRHKPVVFVSYHDALAFCLWKSRQTGRIIRLPSPHQWLAAKNGPENRESPWGKGTEFNPQHCNLLTSGWGRRLPVFALPEGQSPEGVYHLVGNVCEWTGLESVMGGGWQDDGEKLARIEFTFKCAAEARRNDVGFRYVENRPGGEKSPSGERN